MPMGLDVLSDSQKAIFRVAEQIAEAVKKGESVQDILTKARWSAQTFGSNVAKILKNPTVRRALGASNRKILETAVKAAGVEATEAMAAAGVSLASLSSGLILLAGIVVVGAAVAGFGYMAYNWNKPTTNPISPVQPPQRTGTTAHKQPPPGVPKCHTDVFFTELCFNSDNDPGEYFRVVTFRNQRCYCSAN